VLPMAVALMAALAAVCWAPSLTGYRTDRTNLAASRTQEVADLPLARGRAGTPLMKEGKERGIRGTLQARLVGVGSATPAQRITNVQLEGVVDTSDEWIQQRTGISARHLLAPGEGLADLSVEAATKALEHAGVAAEDVELVILASSSPDDMFGDAAYVAQKVGCGNAAAFDLTAACSGFMFAVSTAGQFLHTGHHRTALVVGADALSRWVDWSDRNTCVLFGDGAGAVVMKTAEAHQRPGILGYEMRSDGAGRCHLNLGYSGESVHLTDTSGEGEGEVVAEVTKGEYKPIGMNGKRVYQFATSKAPAVLQEALDAAQVSVEDVDWLLLHQANIRIIEIVAEKLGIPMSKVLTNLKEHGNTSAGTIPLCLDEAVKSGQVKNGDVVAMAGFGAGLSWGAAVIRWEGPEAVEVSE